MRTTAKIEIALLVPITIVMTPLLTFGAGMLSVSAFAMLISRELSPRDALGFAALIVWMLAGLGGLIMVWIVTIENEIPVAISLRSRVVRIAALLAGAISASLWLYDTVRLQTTWDFKSLAFWAFLFAGPIILGLKNGLRLLRTGAYPLPD